MHCGPVLRAAPALAVPAAPLQAAELPKVTKVELQPLAAQVQRVVEGLEMIGAPLSAADKEALQAAASNTEKAKAVAQIQTILDQHCLVSVQIRAAGRVLASTS